MTSFVMKHQTQLKTHTTTGLCWLGALCLLAVVALQSARAVDPVLIGQWKAARPGGYARAVAVSGHYAYVADGYPSDNRTLLVIDVTNSACPVLVGGCYTGGYANGLVVSGNYAYVAADAAGLKVVDVRNPAKPRIVGRHDVRGYTMAVAVSGHYAYVTDSYMSNVLMVLDVSNPANPVQLGMCGVGGYPNAVAVSGNYAYIAGEIHLGTSPYHAGRLDVIDVSNPANPVRVGGYDLMGSPANGVAVSGKYAYLAATMWTSSANHGGLLKVVDVSNPANPVWVGDHYTRGDDAMGVVLSGNLAYVAVFGDNTLNPGGLKVLDVSNPASAVPLGSVSSYYPKGVAVSGTYAYLTDAAAGLKVISVDNPTNPVTVGGGYETFGFGPAAVLDHYAYVVNRSSMEIINFNDPRKPFRVTTYLGIYSGMNIAISGRYGCVVCDWEDGDGGLQMIDLSNPEAPVTVGACTIPGAAYGVAVRSNLVFAASMAGLQIVDVSNPTNPVPLASYDTGYAVDVAVSGNLAFVVDAEEDVKIMDVHDPAHPLCLGIYESQDPLAVAVSGQHAFIADAMEGLLILDVANPANPILVSGYQTYAYGVRLAGNLAILTDHRGTHILDVSDRGNPVDLGYDNEIPPIFAVSGNLAFALDDWGLTLLQFLPLLRNVRDVGPSTFQIYAEVGGQCMLEYASALPCNNWTALPTFTLTNSPQTIVDLTATNAPQRFYRARLAP